MVSGKKPRWIFGDLFGFFQTSFHAQYISRLRTPLTPSVAVSVPGNMLTGYISDRYASRIVVPISASLAALACLGLWGFGMADSVLVCFSILWGLTALSFCAFWSRIITEICGDDPLLPGIIFSTFASLKGIGSLTSGPISTALLSVGAIQNASGAYGRTNYVRSKVGAPLALVLG